MPGLRELPLSCAILLAVASLAASSAVAQDVPRHCAMTAGAERYGDVTVGSALRLGRHAPWNADANWDPQMERFVGATAIVTQLAGVDSAGCPGVRVGIDGGQFFWRIRDAQLALYGAPPPMPGHRAPIRVDREAIPRHCGMVAGRASYGALRPGTDVVLGRHTVWGGDANWSAGMERFVGSVATITSLDGVDAQGCPGVRVHVDGGQWFWRIRDMQLAAGGYRPLPVPPPPPLPIRRGAA
jgi:hypothetical protein